MRPTRIKRIGRGAPSEVESGLTEACPRPATPCRLAGQTDGPTATGGQDVTPATEGHGVVTIDDCAFAVINYRVTDARSIAFVPVGRGCVGDCLVP